MWCFGCLCGGDGVVVIIIVWVVMGWWFCGGEEMGTFGV
jgi:hypothetical protein